MLALGRGALVGAGAGRRGRRRRRGVVVGVAHAGGGAGGHDRVPGGAAFGVEPAAEGAHPVGALLADGDPAAAGPVVVGVVAVGVQQGQQPVGGLAQSVGPLLGGDPDQVDLGVFAGGTSTWSGRWSNKSRMILTCSGPICPRAWAAAVCSSSGGTGCPVRVRRGPRCRASLSRRWASSRGSATDPPPRGHRGRAELDGGGFGVQAGQDPMGGAGDAARAVSRASSTVSSSGWVRVSIGRSTTASIAAAWSAIAEMTMSRSSTPESILEHTFEHRQIRPRL